MIAGTEQEGLKHKEQNLTVRYEIAQNLTEQTLAAQNEPAQHQAALRVPSRGGS